MIKLVENFREDEKETFEVIGEYLIARGSCQLILWQKKVALQNLMNIFLLKI